ncbi:MAG: sulfotransferase [Actinomycetota bacterium]|nr:sulfotransferase [Actinomycetota bacterium]
MLNAHREVAVPPESRFVVELWTGDGRVRVRELLAKLAAHPRFQAWDLPIEMVEHELHGAEETGYAAAIEAAYRAYARVNGKARWGDKTPRYVEHIPLLARLWPESRFVHLVRDGRNVALSYADVPFGPKTVAKAAELWASRVRMGIESGRSLGERYIEIRYEDLVEDAEGEAKDLCEFLGLDFDSGMLDYTERARGAVLPRAKRYNPHVAERPISKIRSWEQSMPDAQVEVFEAIAGDVLSELGYERRHPRTGLKARVVAGAGRRGLPVTRLKGRPGTERA